MTRDDVRGTRTHLPEARDYGVSPVSSRAWETVAVASSSAKFDRGRDPFLLL